ncbi:MAG: hypothetical protein WBX30_29050, partial [Stellaceae bacterium]
LLTPEQAAPQPSTRSLIEQGEPRGLRLLRIVLPLAVNRHRTVTLRDFGLTLVARRRPPNNLEAPGLPSKGRAPHRGATAAPADRPQAGHHRTVARVGF